MMFPVLLELSQTTLKSVIPPLVLISSSGKSMNMINACKADKKKKISKIITLTGNKKNNPLSKLGNINLWVDSNVYNHVENIHQIWLLSICDLIKLNKIK